MSDDDPTREPLDDPDHPALTMSQAAELLGVQAGLPAQPRLDRGPAAATAPPAGTGGTPARQLQVAARVRGLLDDGHPLSSAQLIVRLQDDLTDARDERDVARQQLRDQAG